MQRICGYAFEVGVGVYTWRQTYIRVSSWKYAVLSYCVLLYAPSFLIVDTRGIYFSPDLLALPSHP